MTGLEAEALGLAPAVDFSPKVDLPAAQLSARERIQAKLRAARKGLTHDFDIPGYDGLLVARYEPIDPMGRGKEIGEKIMVEFTSAEDRNFFGAIETIIAACVGVYAWDDGKLELIDEGYNVALAEYLEIEADDARQNVIETFCGNNMWILAHGRRLAAWMQNPASAVALGEA